jgi:glucose-1-phosphate thymidylyltransferase
MKALVLAAGYATRLYPLTIDTPKALLEVGGRPLLDWICDKIDEVPGIDAIHVVTNRRFAGTFEAWAAGRTGVSVHDDGTLTNDDRLGAIGDIAFVVERAPVDDDLLVLAGDNLFASGIEGFVAEGQRHGAPMLAVHDVGDPELMSQYNTVEADADGRITYFEEKPERASSTLAGIALYWYPRDALPLVRRYLEEGNKPDQPGRLIEWLYPRTPVYVWELRGEWYDIGTPEQLEQARAEFDTKTAR